VKPEPALPDLSAPDYLWRPAPVDTPRLLIRPYREDDLAALHDIHRRADVVRYVSWPAHASLEESRLLLETRRTVPGLATDGDKLVLAVTDKQDGHLLGEVALILNDRALLQGEIGFILHPDHQGHGYAFEAAQAMLEIGFRNAGLRRIIGRCDARNAASAGLMEKLGLRREAQFRQSEWIKGEWIDRLIYACLAGEARPGR
jgi:RimJ/RimL family protein N-acetyltransferase